MWYSVTKRVERDVLVFHVGASDPDHALPKRQHFRSHSAKDGCAAEGACEARGAQHVRIQALCFVMSQIMHHF